MKTVIEETNGYVEANMYDDKDYENKNPIINVEIRLPRKDNPNAVLETFFVFPRAWEEEGKEKYKGEGKKSLCKVIQQLIDEKKLTPKTGIELEASGGKASKDFTSTESEKELDAFLAKYPKALEILNKIIKTNQWLARELPDRPYTDADKVKDKARLAEDIRQNQRLVAYYKTYGFTVVPGKDEGNRTPMTGTIGGILSACQTGGKKTRRTKKTRKFSRRK